MILSSGEYPFQETHFYPDALFNEYKKLIENYIVILKKYHPEYDYEIAIDETEDKGLWDFIWKIDIKPLNKNVVIGRIIISDFVNYEFWNIEFRTRETADIFHSNLDEIFNYFKNNVRDNPEFAKIINNHFWELYNEKEKGEEEREMTTEQFEKFKKAIESLYNLNAMISGCFITGLCRIKNSDIETINQKLGDIIKCLRELERSIGEEK